jgi:RimJ/RimL family protein N-acetyltransferase
MTPPNLWQGQAVRLRAVEPDDWQAFFEWNADTDVARAAYFIPLPASREAVKKWAAEQAALDPKSHEFRWVIENLAGEMVGTLNTHACDTRQGTFRYGVALRREHWRRGYASEAVQLVLAYFFRELRYQKVNVEIYAFNEASLKLHQKLGFQEEGRLRRMVYTGGVYHDAVILGLTAEEFEEAWPEKG